MSDYVTAGKSFWNRHHATAKQWLWEGNYCRQGDDWPDAPLPAPVGIDPMIFPFTIGMWRFEFERRPVRYHAGVMHWQVYLVIPGDGRAWCGGYSEPTTEKGTHVYG